MKKSISGLLISIITLGMLACEAPMTFMSGGEEEEEITIESIQTGSFLSAEKTIPLSLSYDKDRVVLKKVTVDLLAPDGTLVGTQILDAAELLKSELPEIKLPDIDSGHYMIKYQGYDAEGEIAVEHVVEFFYVEETYSVTNITSFPPTITPGAEALLSGKFEYPVDSDPYVRWSMDDTILKKGLLSQGYDKLHWDAPEIEGVYSVKLEIFPCAPPTGGSFEFQSEEYMEAEIFVKEQQTSSSPDFEDENFYSLLHFQGSMEDTGAGPVKGGIEPIGNPTVDVRGNVFGYYCDGESGFAVEEVLLPFDETFFGPFTLSMKLYLDKQPKNKVLFLTTDSAESFSFRLSTDESGMVTAAVDYDEKTIISRSDITLLSETAYQIGLSLFPDGNEVVFIWYADGNRIKTEKFDLPAFPVTPEGFSRIGGEDGFVGVIDEFSVFYRDNKGRENTDPGIFFRRAKEQYDGDLLYAEGFDGLYLPEDFETEESLSVSAGQLVIEPEGAVAIPEFVVGHEQISFELHFSQAIGSNVQTLRIDSSYEEFIPISIGLDGTVMSAEEESASFTPDNRTLLIDFLHDENGMKVVIGTKEIAAFPYEADNIPMNITFTNGGKEDIFLLEKILIHSVPLRTVKKDSAPDGAETDVKKSPDYNST